MNKSFKLATVAIVGLGLMAPVAFSQGTQQTVGLTRVDPATLTTGYRTSKMVGSSVMNEAKETVGTIDDLILTQNERVPYAVLSVGGFLGMGTKLVVVPSSQLQVVGKDVILPGATKESLKNLPEFKYAS